MNMCVYNICWLGRPVWSLVVTVAGHVHWGSYLYSRDMKPGRKVIECHKDLVVHFSCQELRYTSVSVIQT